MKISLNLVFVLIAFLIHNGVNCHRRRQFKVTSYNTALIDGRILADQTTTPNKIVRRDKIIDMLNDIDTDFVCLQEVWVAEDVAAIVYGVRKKFKYSFSGVHVGKKVAAFQRPKAEPVCTFESVFNFFTCIENNCLGAQNRDEAISCTLACLAESLETAEPPISEECYACLVTSFPEIPIMMSDCAGDGNDGPFRKMNINGLLILSKHKLSKTRNVDFFPSTRQIVVRGYLSAKIRGIKAVCTHLSSEEIIGYVEDELADQFGFTSYSEQNAFEVQLLIKTFKSVKHLLLLGDFGTSLATVPGVQPLIEASYQTLSAVFDTTPVNECTLCSNEINPFSFEDENNYIVDHVFTKGLCIESARRVFTQQEYSFFVGLQMIPLSDHYGVQANILPSLACSRRRYH